MGARGDSLLEDGVGIVKDKDHACASSAECSGTEVLVLGRLVSKPEIRSAYWELGDDDIPIIHPQILVAPNAVL